MKDQLQETFCQTYLSQYFDTLKDKYGFGSSKTNQIEAMWKNKGKNLCKYNQSK